MSSPNTPAGASSGRRILANRRNALKSTGPRSAAGKRRVALNARRRGLCSQELEQQFRAQGEDPREFRRLHRDLIAILHPGDGAAVEAVELMAHTWWEKARRIRNWVAAPTDDLDARLERLLVLFAHAEGGGAQVVGTSTGCRLGPVAGVSRRCATEDRTSAATLWSQAGSAKVPTADAERAAAPANRGGTFIHP